MLKNLINHIYIYIYSNKIMEGRLFTNKSKQSLFNYGRRLLVNNNLLLVGGAY